MCSFWTRILLSLFQTNDIQSHLSEMIDGKDSTQFLSKILFTTAIASFFAFFHLFIFRLTCITVNVVKGDATKLFIII